jgi:drug/metabolite transporter (DMT)-like permease
MTDNIKGSLLMIAAMALFAIEDMFIKLAGAVLPSGQIVFVLGAFGAPVFIVLARRQGLRIFTKDALHPAVLLRNLGEMLGTLGFIIALAALPLALVLAVMQAMPLVVTMGAALFLGERVGWRRWGAILVGFCGVLLVIRPGMEGFDPTALWLILAVLGMGARDLVSRAIPARLNNAQVSAWGLLSVALLGALMMIEGGAVAVDLVSAAWLGGGIIFGTAGYWAITAAARTGEVSVVAPFRYVRLIFAMTIGLFVFAEVPDTLTLIGAAIIVTSGLYAFMRERARKAALSNAPPLG